MGNSHGPSLLPMEARGHGAATQKRSVFFGTRRFNLAHRVVVVSVCVVCVAAARRNNLRDV